MLSETWTTCGKASIGFWSGNLEAISDDLKTGSTRRVLKRTQVIIAYNRLIIDKSVNTFKGVLTYTVAMQRLLYKVESCFDTERDEVYARGILAEII